MTEKRQQNISCSMEAALNVLSGKWKLTILNRLLPGTQRYSDLKKQIPAITEKMLTQQLRELEEDGIISRKVYPVVPPRVEYTFTNTGLQLADVFKSLAIWGKNFTKADERVNAGPSCYEFIVNHTN